MGRPRTNFKPYKDLKRKKSGIVNFFMDDNFIRAIRYTAPSIRKHHIEIFLKKTKVKNGIKHIFHYEIIPYIDE